MPVKKVFSFLQRKLSLNKKMVFIGCGSGRCGTVSLSKLINGCENIFCTHEMFPHLPWKVNGELLEQRISYFKRSIAGNFSVGDVAYYYLPYIPKIIETTPDVKVICLKRDKEETIRSMEDHVGRRNHWMLHSGRWWRKDDVWDNTFPKYKTKNRRKAIANYWDEYYARAEKIQKRYPGNFVVMNIDVLNSVGGQDEIFDFVGIPAINRRYIKECRYNQTIKTGGILSGLLAVNSFLTTSIGNLLG